MPVRIKITGDNLPISGLKSIAPLIGREYDAIQLSQGTHFAIHEPEMGGQIIVTTNECEIVNHRYGASK